MKSFIYLFLDDCYIYSCAHPTGGKGGKGCGGNDGGQGGDSQKGEQTGDSGKPAPNGGSSGLGVPNSQGQQSSQKFNGKKGADGTKGDDFRTFEYSFGPLGYVAVDLHNQTNLEKFSGTNGKGGGGGGGGGGGYYIGLCAIFGSGGEI